MQDNECGYSLEWQPYKMDYDKLEYDIKLKDGTIITNCYPNAQKFNSFSKENDKTPAVKEEEIAEIRITAENNQILGINPDKIYQSLSKG